MWSLAVEEHFYILFPVVLVALRKRPDRLQWVLVGSLLFCLVWRIYLVGLGYGVERVQRGTDTRLDSIAYGCLLSLMFQRAKSDARVRRWLDLLSGRSAFIIGCLLLLASLAIRDESFRLTLRYSIQGMAFATLFCAIFWSRSAPGLLVRALESRPMVFIGVISYSLYLYHEFGLIFAKALSDDESVKIAVALAIGLPATLASYYFVETPARRFGMKLAGRLERTDMQVRLPASQGD